MLDLFQLVAAHDKRKYDPAEVELWGKHAKLAHWTHGEACAAVIGYYHDREVHDFSDWIGPGDVTVRINQARRGGRQLGQPRPVEALPQGNGAGSEHQAACLAEIRAILATPKGQRGVTWPNREARA